MSIKKVYGSYGHTGETNWIQRLGFVLTSNIDEADVVVFGGGKDVDPGFYGDKLGLRTDPPSNRDKKEKEDFEYIQKLRAGGKVVKTCGVCRGAQLICALSGGKLIQDVGNHFGSHTMSTFDRRKMQVNSIHHQMMFPFPMKKEDYKVLSWSTELLSSKYLDGHNKPMWLPKDFKELETVIFKNTDSLAIQSHPEMMVNRKDYDTTLGWFQDIFTKFYYNTI